MITQYEVPGLLQEAIPQMPATTQFHSVRLTTDIYTSINYFSAYTKHAVEAHNFSLARKCFAFAEKLYKQGDSLIRLLIENIFVYSFSSFLPDERTDKQMLRKMIPSSLYAVYIKQVTGGGC